MTSNDVDPFPEIPSVDDCIDWMMGSRSRARAELLEHGRFSHPGACCSGPLQPTVTVVSKGLEVERPTAEQWAVEVTWHRYCRKYGYPRGSSDGYPPTPWSAGKPPTIIVTWARLRARFEREATGQLDMF
ncbi:MAG TPA: hypothetical protein PKB03_00045 [Baekduia sp.]|nr:hypothetical protein [Baekduia sp.]